MRFSKLLSGLNSNRFLAALLVISIVFLTSILGLRLFGKFWANILMVDYSKRLIVVAVPESGDYPLINVLIGDTEKTLGERVLDVFPSSLANGSHILWTTGRLKLARGEYQEAADDFQLLRSVGSNNHFLNQDTLCAFSLSDQSDQTITYYETIKTKNFSPATNDAVAYSYLMASLDPDQEAKGLALSKVIALRPDDLYANFHLWKNPEIVDGWGNLSVFHEALINPTHTSLNPTDRRLLEFVTQSFFDLYHNRLWERNELAANISFLIQQQANPQLVQDLLIRLVTVYPSDDIWHSLLGVSYKTSGYLEEAIQSLEKALSINSDHASAYLDLGMLYEAECEDDKTSCILRARDNYEQFLRLRPESLLAIKKMSETNEALKEVECLEPNSTANEKGRAFWLAEVLKAGPEREMNTELGEWNFLGYRVDEAGIASGEYSSFWVYWIGPKGESPGREEDGWYHLAKNTWVQLIESPNNLVYDGGFELGTLSNIPAGFSGEMYLTSEDARYLSSEERSGVTTKVAVLDNDNNDNQSSYISPEIALEADSLYLQTGWIRSLGGIGYYGRNWKGRDLELPQTHSYLAAGVKSNNWSHHSEVLEPPDNATHLQVWMLNVAPRGQVQFDDVILIRIDDPR